MTTKRTYATFIAYFFMIACLLNPQCADDIRNPNNALIVSDAQASTDDDDITITVEDDVPKEVFHPSKNWKPIKPGQAIPKGLHVRINLATGQKEARLFQDREDVNSDNSQDSSSDSQQKEKFSPQELKEALKSIKADDISNPAPQLSKAKFRSLEELRKEFSNLHLNIKSETDILVDLLERYRKCNDEEDKIKVLEDLEYIVHQFDVAQDLVHLDGLQLLLPDLNSSLTSVRSLVCATLGSAMQGNPRVQISVLEQNGLSVLTHLLVLDKSLSVRARALFAVSCLVRNFPFAQWRLVENGGIQLMANILREDVSADPNSLKIKLKVVTLLNDLLVEQEFAQRQSSSEDNTSVKHPSFSIRKLLVENNFCDLIGNLLAVPGTDIQERVITTMKHLSPDCTFREQLPALLDTAKIFEEQTETGSQLDEDTNQLLMDIRSLVDRAMKKDEL